MPTQSEMSQPATSSPLTSFYNSNPNREVNLLNGKQICFLLTSTTVLFLNISCLLHALLSKGDEGS